MSKPEIIRQTSSASLPHRTSHSSSAASSTPTSSNTAIREPAESRSPRDPAATNATATNSTDSEAQTRQRAQQLFRTDSNTSAGRTARSSAPKTSADVVRRIVSPGSVLFAHQPPPPITVQRLQESTIRPTANMDRRHPSSFQQLEKLGEGTYATVRQSTSSRVMKTQY